MVLRTDGDTDWAVMELNEAWELLTQSINEDQVSSICLHTL